MYKIWIQLYIICICTLYKYCQKRVVFIYLRNMFWWPINYLEYSDTLNLDFQLKKIDAYNEFKTYCCSKICAIRKKIPIGCVALFLSSENWVCDIHYQMDQHIGWRWAYTINDTHPDSSDRLRRSRSTTVATASWSIVEHVKG